MIVWVKKKLFHAIKVCNPSFFGPLLKNQKHFLSQLLKLDEIAELEGYIKYDDLIKKAASGEKFADHLSSTLINWIESHKKIVVKPMPRFGKSNDENIN